MSLLSDIGTAIKNKLGGTSVDNTVPRYDGTTCKLQGSSVTIDDNGGISAYGINSLNGTFRTQNFAGVATDGVVYFGNAVSYIWKYGNKWEFYNEQSGIRNYIATAGDIVTETTAKTWAINITGTSTYATNATNTIGYNQSWQDVTASRASRTTYTNSTGKPIMVLITFYNDIVVELGAIPAFLANNEGLANATSNISLIIPSGSIYRFSSDYGILKWMELR